MIHSTNKENQGLINRNPLGTVFSFQLLMPYQTG